MPTSSVRMINLTALGEADGWEGDAGDCDASADTPTDELASNIQLAIAIGRNESMVAALWLRTVFVLLRRQTCPCKVKQQAP